MWTDGIWASFCIFCCRLLPHKVKPVERHFGGPECGQGTYFWLLQTLIEGTSQVSHYVLFGKVNQITGSWLPGRRCWTLKASQLKLPRGKLKHWRPLTVWLCESGLEDRYIWQKVQEKRLGITRRRKKAIAPLCLCMSKVWDSLNEHFQSANHHHHHHHHQS